MAVAAESQPVFRSHLDLAHPGPSSTNAGACGPFRINPAASGVGMARTGGPIADPTVVLYVVSALLFFTRRFSSKPLFGLFLHRQ